MLLGASTQWPVRSERTVVGGSAVVRVGDGGSPAATNALREMVHQEQRERRVALHHVGEPVAVDPGDHGVGGGSCVRPHGLHLVRFEEWELTEDLIRREAFDDFPVPE